MELPDNDMSTDGSVSLSSSEHEEIEENYEHNKFIEPNTKSTHDYDLDSTPMESSDNDKLIDRSVSLSSFDQSDIDDLELNYGAPYNEDDYECQVDQESTAEHGGEHEQILMSGDNISYQDM